MRKFFVQKPVLAAFSSYVLALAKNLYEKCARLTLMKLTPAVKKAVETSKENIHSICSNQKLFGHFVEAQ